MRCGAPVRGGVPPYGECGLAAGHTGYHAGVTFTCDGCGGTYRGSPYREGGVTPQADGSYADVFGFCFLCVKDGERQERIAACDVCGRRDDHQHPEEVWTESELREGYGK